ncbi:MAG: YIP1 family protein [Eubacteriales bacterium]
MKNIVRISALVMALFLVLGSLSVFAAAYETYTYSIDSFTMASPDAYTPEKTVNSVAMGLEELPIDDPKDIFVDDQMNVYIADATNNRIVVLSEYFNYKFSISTFTNDEGIPDSLTAPNGLYVTETKIFVADTDNNRIVIFDREGNFIKVLKEPEADVFPEGSIYKPIALAVDKSERIYVVSSTTYMGVIVLDNEGVFQSFIGAQKVTANPLDILWRNFQTTEQRAQSTQYVSTEFNNVTIDDEGFIYVTTSSIDEGSQQMAIYTKDGNFSPVKKLNTAGNDIMARNGFFGPGGEVSIRSFSYEADAILGASKIIDVAVGPEKTWSIIDEKRQRVYTYDDNGNMLFAFGDKGMQLGNLQSIEGIVYQGEKMLLLDKTDDSITVYNRTEYGDILINALKNNNERNYDLAVTDWKAILQRNSNFDTAYVGIGKALYRGGDWEGAMQYFKYAYDTANYSNSFKMWRQNWVSKYVLVIPIVVVALSWLLSRFFGYANKVNKKTALLTSKRTFKQEILYGFYLIFHPFDGFWDLKHEKRGSVRAAFFYILLTIIAFTYQAVGRSYIYNPRARFSSIFIQVISIMVPLLLWVAANWCLTTLMEGEGSFKDIFIAVGYSILPLSLFIIPATLLTHIATASEAGMINLLITVAWTWVGLLIFFGMMITHDYSLVKNVITSIMTIAGMAFIMFVGILFSTLVAKIIGFISSIVTEISYRL